MVTFTINNKNQENEALISLGENGARWSTDVFPEDFKPSLTENFTGFPYAITLNSNQITY